MISLLFGGLKKWLLIAGGVVAAVLGIYTKGRMDSRNRHKIKDQQAELDTHDRINNAENIHDNTAAGEWLRARSKRKRSVRKNR